MFEVRVANLASNVYLGGELWVVKRYFFENVYVALVELTVLYFVNVQLIDFLVHLGARFESKIRCSGQFGRKLAKKASLR